MRVIYLIPLLISVVLAKNSLKNRVLFFDFIPPLCGLISSNIPVNGGESLILLVDKSVHLENIGESIVLECNIPSISFVHLYPSLSPNCERNVEHLSSDGRVISDLTKR